VLLFANPLLINTALGVPKLTPLYPSCQTSGLFCTGWCNFTVKATATSTRGGAGVFADLQLNNNGFWFSPLLGGVPQCRKGTSTTTNQSCTVSYSGRTANTPVRADCWWHEKALIVDHGAKITCSITTSPT